MTIRVLQGDCRDVLPTLPANSVHCVVSSPPYYALRSYLDASHPDKHREIGSEATPDEYIQTMVAVFREVRRVLRDDGTCWVNMGDSYNTYPGNRGASKSISANINDAIPALPQGHGLTTPTLANKQLLMMPARMALALQADGWWIRSDIIWAKPNPMPESVTDRCVSAHEHIFMLTKSPRYYFDAEAIKETSVSDHPSGNGYKRDARLSYADANGARGNDEQWQMRPTRSPRNVWTIATHAYPEAHFATYPPELAERCIKAGTSERGCCAQCGTPWVRQTERTTLFLSGSGIAGNLPEGKGRPGDGQIREGHDIRMGNTSSVATTGWLPGCQCNAPTQPCTVLDPFAGAGTTMLVADRLQRHAIGIELNESYAVMARNRIVVDAPLFAEVAD